MSEDQKDIEMKEGDTETEDTKPTITSGDTEEENDANGETGTENTTAEEDNDDRKLFVGGISWETTSTDLTAYFSKFGEVSECVLKTDPTTGRSRGFGFVVFADISSVEKVLKEKEHKLHGRVIDPKRANPKKFDTGLKVFVGGLNPDTSETDIRDHFSTFGKIVEMDVPLDTDEKRRGFCFIKFDTEETVKKVIANRIQTIGGKECEVKKSLPRYDSSRGRGGGFGGRGGSYGGGRGGDRGRGRGGYGGYQQQGYGGANNYYNPGYSNYNYNQGYGTGGYSSYGGYDAYNYNNYYQQQGYSSWPGYDQSGYGYGGYGSGYDYSQWGYGQDQGQQYSSAAAKPVKRGVTYHPYQR